jgi:hypothetical protein
MNSKLLLGTAVAGLAASILVGLGEGLLHYSANYGSSEPYEFLVGVSTTRLALGHFIAVLSAPLYLVGYWHVAQMLNPRRGALSTGLAMAAGYGLIIGTVWIGSRAMIGSIVHLQSEVGLSGSSLTALVRDYELYFETLLWVTRLAILLFSAGFAYLVWKGSTPYPRWMAVFNPFVILVAVFLTYPLAPSVGRLLAPIGMNVAHFIFFSLSLWALLSQSNAANSADDVLTKVLS